MPTAPPMQGFGIDGFVIKERTPTQDQLYMTPAEIEQQYGMCVTEGQVRHAMAHIHTYVNRPSLWLEEFQERRDIASDRNQIILSARPVVRVTAAVGRYGYGRRDQTTLNQVNYDYLAALAVFGSPPRFTNIDVEQLEVYAPTGEVWLPTGLFLINYTQVQIKYLTGFEDIPDRVKHALLEVLNNICNKGASDRKVYVTGKTRREYSEIGFLTSTAKAMLDPFVVRSLC